ncbi:PH domain-containing protein [Natrarchaeobius chitinivorans]|uniref:PH domain-containing protein n=1 Tax=Natrarchaeobius chitinivorans TaxID=1679083 RepID=A0A3N6MMK2_NATCH|nr:PH domain-containing protein [Natrarchaeobius chitinivorans]RQG97311.1 PH domain-containing protein [Natrarchaeobius chitinivorans]
MSAVDRSPARTDDADDPLEWLVLLDGDGSNAAESIRWRGGPRLQTAYPWIGLAVLGAVIVTAAVVLGVVSALWLLGIPVLAFPAIWAVASVVRTEYAITNRRIAIRRGVLGVSVETVGVDRVQNSAISQHAIARAVGYGTVTIEAASGGTFSFRNVEDPTAVHDRLEALNECGRPGDLPGSAAEWEAVLAEIQGWRQVLERSS